MASTEDHYAQAAEMLIDEDWMGAIVAFSKVLKLDSFSVKAMTGRASAHIKMKNYAAALQVQRGP
jgi:hypothetical protein